MTRPNAFALLAVLGALVAVAASPSRGWAQEEPEAAGSGAAAEAAEGKEEGGGHDEGEHGAEGDLAHANASDSLSQPLDFRSDLAIFTLVVFVLLLAILYKFAWKPIMEGLTKRENSIAENIEQAKRSAAEAQAMLAQYESRLAAASAEAQQMIAESRKKGEQAMEKLIADGRETAQKELTRAQQEIRAAKEMALADLAQRSVDSAVSLAGRLVKKEIGPHEHSLLIQEALDHFPSKN